MFYVRPSMTPIEPFFLESLRPKASFGLRERLNVVQQLGWPRFVRNKSGASVASAGEQFLRYGPTFVQLRQCARHQVAIPPGHHRAVLTVVSEVSLWQSR